LLVMHSGSGVYLFVCVGNILSCFI
jgi:hypothetical protein